MQGAACASIYRYALLCCYCCSIASAFRVVDRKGFVEQSAFTILATNFESNKPKNSKLLLEDEEICWNDNNGPTSTINWNEIRYGSSTLQGAKVPQPARTATFFPSWMKGYWLGTYKLSNVSFPQGRKNINLQLAGAGIGTCLSLPNVGVNPRPLVLRFLDAQGGDSCYEDAAYNMPRRLEAFCTGTTVESIQTGSSNLQLSPKCLVTGEGCLAVENPTLRDPSTRLRMDFVASTRRQGAVRQTVDQTLLRTNIMEENETYFIASRHYAQFNIQQDLQTFYREILSLTPSSSNGVVEGRIRVAGFLPADYSASQSHDDNRALVTYDYKLTLQSIDEEEARQV